MSIDREKQAGANTAGQSELIEPLGTEPEIFENLCVYDLRNPDRRFLYDAANASGIELPEPRDNCACDNCFYGKDKLALRIIELELELRSRCLFGKISRDDCRDTPCQSCTARKY